VDCGFPAKDRQIRVRNSTMPRILQWIGSEGLVPNRAAAGIGSGQRRETIATRMHDALRLK